MHTLHTIQTLVDQISVSSLLYTNPRWRLMVKGDGVLLQFVYDEPDSEDESGEAVPQYCRKWYISLHSTDTEIVRTAYKAVQASLEHRLGEHFRFRGVQIYNPHTSIETMLSNSINPLDGRKVPT